LAPAGEALDQVEPSLTSLVLNRPIGGEIAEGLSEGVPDADQGGLDEGLAEFEMRIRGRCARSPFDLVNTVTGELIPGRCDAAACYVCGPLAAVQKSAAMTWAAPERFITLTGVPLDWQERRQHMRELKRQAKGEGWRLEWAWATERNPRGTGAHVHALQWGDYVPQAWLQDRNGAIAHITRIKGDGARVAGYTIKGDVAAVCGYALKGGQVQMDLRGHLEVNGGRLVHMSRGFLRGRRFKEVLGELVPREGTWKVVPRDRGWNPLTRARRQPARPGPLSQWQRAEAQRKAG
jgi:hypothetical protein